MSFSISIHALREEGDVKKDYYYMLNVISIHALREEGDVIPLLFAMLKSPFLSTPSARRATVIRCYSLVCQYDFYPRPPRGGRRLKT